ncbi:zinc-finger homeodomain protein 2-like [Dendrobium catenatum]|uniref:ZF-HD homeobox protein n=1 Tax=Dendrobium catenatum TaxID=906689 RepID=A0A2I0VAT8_9ASPA|nr:zinc-finger homeodomain protein 2-like [Dendrobium catenatum]PKU60523.1 ZF-HD homeobox protein [Dendrobium catenatum]
MAAVEYRECLKNQCVAPGFHTVDGCQFFFSGNDPSAVFNCAACSCHRSFHRKNFLKREPERSPSTAESSTSRPRAGGIRRKKELFRRRRRRFTAEQKEKMLACASLLGWRVGWLRAEVESFCEEVGIEEKAFFNWMRNNKRKYETKP